MDLKSPRSRRRDRSRRSILAAARDLVLEKGADKLSLRAVAARAGYSPAALYEYFDSKGHLVAELADEVMTRFDARLSRVPTNLSPTKILVRYGLAYIGFARENPEDFMLVFSKLRSQRASTATPPGNSPYARLVRTAQAGLESGVFAARPDLTAEPVAYGLWSLAHGLAMLQLTHLRDFEADFETADRLALEAYVAGLSARP